MSVRISRECVAIVPAKGSSARVPRKNSRAFWRGLSLVEVKIRVLARCSTIDRTIVSSDDLDILEQSRTLGAETVLRSKALCGDHVDLRDLFHEVLSDHKHQVVYWAHPTSPFVTPSMIERAVGIVREAPERCVLGVERVQGFFWTSEHPLNYSPGSQPRSQDLPPFWRVTGGIHVAVGDRFIHEGALAFDPVSLMEMPRVESFDIDTEEDWEICSYLADQILPELLD